MARLGLLRRPRPYSRRIAAAARGLPVRLPQLRRVGGLRAAAAPWWLLAPFAAVAVLVWAAAFSLPDGKLHVTFFDVGQGDSALITTPSGKQVLVDGGPDPDLAAQRLGASIPFWDRSIDVAVLTHAHADHVTGMVEALRRYDVGYVIESRAAYESLPYEIWRNAVTEENATVIVASRGQVIDFGDGVTMTVVNPPEPRLTGTSSDVDNASVVLRFVYGSTAFLLTGDVFAEAERLMAAEGAKIRSTVLKVAHHGSRTSSDATFLEAVSPVAAVISTGEDNRFGHPHAESLAAQEAAVGEDFVFLTRDRGTIEFVTDGKTLRVKTER